MIARGGANFRLADTAHPVVPFLSRQRNDAPDDPPGLPLRFGVPAPRKALFTPLPAE